MNFHKRNFSLMIWLTVVASTLWTTQTSQDEENALRTLKQSLQEREEYVLQMSFLIKMIRDTELQNELEVVPDQIAEMNQLVAEFQQSQMQYTIKNGDRQQRLNQLIREKRVVEATKLSTEMYSEFDVTMLSVNKQVEASILPHQLERLHQIAKQQVLMTRTPFRDEFGVALAIAAELEVSPKVREEVSEKIAAKRRDLLEKIEELRKQAREDVVASFPKEHRKLIADVYAKYYDADKNRRLASEKRFKKWNIAR